MEIPNKYLTQEEFKLIKDVKDKVPQVGTTFLYKDEIITIINVN